MTCKTWWGYIFCMNWGESNQDDQEPELIMTKERLRELDSSSFYKRKWRGNPIPGTATSETVPRKQSQALLGGAQLCWSLHGSLTSPRKQPSKALLQPTFSSVLCTSHSVCCFPYDLLFRDQRFHPVPLWPRLLTDLLEVKLPLKQPPSHLACILGFSFMKKAL